MELYIGSVFHQLDEKNRFRIPTKYRDKLGDNIYFLRGMGGCICVYSRQTLDERFEQCARLHSDDPQKLLAARILFSSAEEVTEDKQKRITLSPELKKFAKINKELVTIGMGTYIEIWAKEEYEKFLTQMSVEEALKTVAF